MPVATNPNGEALRLDESGKWVPTKMATNPQTKETLVLDGDKWVPIGAGPAQQPQQQANKPAPNAIIDSVKSFAAGIPQGIAQLGGTLGDVKGLIDQGGDWVAERMGSTPEQMAERRAIRAEDRKGWEGPPTSEKLNADIQKVTGEYHKPETTAGEYARTIGTFAPNALAPGGLLARAGRVILPGAASEAAGQATKGSKWEPLARAVGALGGGLLEGGIEGAIANRKAPIPSVDELKKSSAEAYKKAKDAGVMIKGDAFKSMAKQTTNSLLEMGIDPDLTPYAATALKRINAVDGDISLKQADTLRKVVSKAISKAAGPDGKEDRALAYVIRDNLDSFISKLDEASVTSGADPSEATKALKQARTLWARKSKGEFIEKLLEKAETRSKQFTGSGKENAIRVEFRKVAMNDKAMAKFTPAEQTAIKKVAEGTLSANVFRRVGAISPQSIPTNMSLGASTLGGTLGSVLGGPMGAAVGVIAPSAVGLAGRGIATHLTAKNAKLAGEIMRAGTQAPAAIGTNPLILNALLSRAAHP